MDNIAKEFSIGKMIVFGEKIEFKNYSVPVCCGNRKHDILRLGNKETGEKRSDNLARSRMNVRYRVWANVTPHSKFLTLTTSDTVLDKEQFVKRLKTFFKAMSREGYKLRYLYVLERQKERGEKEGNAGSIHAHIIIFNDEYIPFDIINKHWNGTTDIHMLDGLREENGEKVKDVGAYVCKYLTKEADLEWGSRCYNCSVGLNKPIIVRKKIYGDENGNYFYNNEEPENMAIEEFEKSTLVTYQNSMIVQYNMGDGIVNQIIDYKQGKLKQLIDTID